MKTSLIKNNDRLWSKIVKAKAGHKCELCGIEDDSLIAHHWVVSRKSKINRWNTDNGLCLCWMCHFIAHNFPENFSALLISIKGRDWYTKVRNKVIKKNQKTRPLYVCDYKKINKTLKMELKIFD